MTTLTKRKRPAVNGEAEDVHLPHDDAAEQGVLGSILIDASVLADCDGVSASAFLDTRHRTIWSAIESMRSRGEPVAPETVFAHLNRNGEMLDAGGKEYFGDLPHKAGLSGNIHHWLEKLRAPWMRRQLMQLGVDAAEGGDLDSLLKRARGLTKKLDPKPSGSTWPFNELATFDTKHDPDALIGVRDDGTTSRYLCRGCSAWLIGPSGIGKSSLAVTFGIYMALGKPLFGIRPVRPLRVSLIQAENDKGDASEMVQGVAAGLGLSEDELHRLKEVFVVHTDCSKTGLEFCSYLEDTVSATKAELAIADPLLSFAGIDVSRQEQCSRFLRSWLNPVLQSTGACLLAAHHTGKPPQERQSKNWATTDWLYHFLGSSELVNWARASMLLTSVDGDGTFRLRLTKRERRAGAMHPDGTPTNIIWLRHSKTGICWEQIDPPAEAEPTAAQEKPKKMTKPEIVQGMNTAAFLANCTSDGESQRGICTRLRNWTVSKDSPKKVILSKGTSETAIALLLESGKLESRDGLYFRGPNA